MLGSISQPSLGTFTDTLTSITTGPTSRINVSIKKTVQQFRGSFFFEKRLGSITRCVIVAPWNIWWQSWILLLIVYEYIVHLLIAYYLRRSYFLLNLSIIICETFFFFDVVIHLLHRFWPILRLYVRLYKRNYIFLAYDVVTLLPLGIIYHFGSGGHEYIILIGRWLGIGRIYRVLVYFCEINEKMRNTRKRIYVMEHIVLVMLALHLSTCLWYSLNHTLMDVKEYYLATLNNVNKKIIFDNYLSCWYYSAGRLFNCIFGDSFPLHPHEKWLTSFLMIFGYVCIRYRFIGGLTWELVLENNRWSIFVEQYHHMINFLKFRRAPPLLVEQAMLYKQTLWNMKDGILTSPQLQTLPLPLQMELIFDVNVQHFHDSLLLRDTGESFMRHMSLYIRHELYLTGQYIWNQDVVKNGMIFVKRGVIEMLSDEDDESPMIAFKEGTVLGEISLFYSIPSKVTVKAATYVELQVLRRTDFLRAMNENPFMLQQIREKVETRIKSCKGKQVDVISDIDIIISYLFQWKTSKYMLI